ncbi:MAG: peptide chain release factor N(5)-glutamine methyltransferase [Patescibacteria group bacterium]|nr:peptide chain release factor N(5)-glutamine methyltransferase [Patescibacteria group bacterium]MDD5716067.1 peptide chain release factor N(5)-glutamine methyltransferase [Patescibacteria group bacterium]
MTIRRALLTAITTLRSSHTASATLDAEVILSFLLHKPRGYLLAYPERKLTPNQASVFKKLIRRRLRGVPVAYLTGHREFYGLDFLVTNATLIPRPETETAVEESIRIGRAMAKAAPDKKTAIADIGTGSGCIAITLAKYLPRAKLYAVDISNKALAIAEKNARQHTVVKRIHFLRGNLLSPIPRKIKLDLIIANLPYLTTDELQNVPFEPKIALDGGKLGLELIDRFMEQLPDRLAPGGIALVEIAPSQVKAVDYFVERSMPEKKVNFLKDLTGRDRVAKIY